MQHPLWNNLLKDYQEQGVLVEGPLSDLHQIEMQLLVKSVHEKQDSVVALRKQLKEKTAIQSPLKVTLLPDTQLNSHCSIKLKRLLY